jgi:hypothetical protein
MLISKENVRFKFVTLLTDYAHGFKWCWFFDNCLCQECRRMLTDAEARLLANLLDRNADEFELDWFVHGVY